MYATSGEKVNLGRKVYMERTEKQTDTKEMQYVKGDVSVQKKLSELDEISFYTKVNISEKRKKELYRKLNGLMGEA